ncbi:hypothetical protein BpHYR1_002577 [Brachionus plicatilis]|uniref:Uncharacterized protein n=1 Tax=Brachionus plicatilis TaxID=10195 RepID=A0A3M7PCN9_BRAPC|nr:hypothetical protein BpHYR1_002577 [Brachionus plicatilis]
MTPAVGIQLPAEDSCFTVENREEAHAQSIVASDQSTTNPADQIQDQPNETIAARDPGSVSCVPEKTTKGGRPTKEEAARREAEAKKKEAAKQQQNPPTRFSRRLANKSPERREDVM